MTDATQQVVQLSLDELVLGSNIRYGLKQEEVEYLARQIEALGGIHTALKVEPHEDGRYVIREGYYRHAAATWLKEHGTEITLPCIIEQPITDPIERIDRQLSENRDRQNLTPMDISSAIEAYIGLGVPRLKIMERFARARPGAKGKDATIEAMSEASYSYYARYKDLPEEMKLMLHHGTLHVAAANRFLDEPDPDKRAQLFVEAERRQQERLNRASTEDKRIEKLEAAEKKDRETVKVKAQEIGELESELKQKKTVSDAAYKGIGNLKGEKREEARKLYRVAAQATSQVSQKLKAAQKERKRAQGRLRQAAFEIREKKHQPAPDHRKRTAMSKKDVDAALADQSGRARLGAIDMRAAVKYWTEAPFPKVQALAVIVQKTFDSIYTPVQARMEMAKITGEEKRPAKKNGRRK